MFFLVSFVVGVLACNEFCSVSCDLFNADPSCYTLCECTGPKNPLILTPSLLSGFEEYKQQIVSDILCDLSKLEQCYSLQSYSELFSCYSLHHCIELGEFKYMTENLPKELWLASSPKIFFSFIRSQAELGFYKVFDKCQRGCFEYLKLSENMKPSFFPYEECVAGCGERLDKDIDENCLDQCVEVCATETGFCMQNCLKRLCGIVEGNRKKKGRKIEFKGNLEEVDTKEYIRCPVDDPEFRKQHGFEVDL